MSSKRITVWVQRFPDRANLVLQWHDPDTGRRKSKSAETADDGQAEKARADLEYELNHGLHKQASAMSWERFRELFEAECVAGRRQNTQENYRAAFDAFERLCRPGRLRSVNERTLSRFVAQMREAEVRGGRSGYAPATVRVRLQLLHAALKWAADQKLIAAVPKFPAVRVPRKKPQPIPAESFERLLDKAPDAQMRAYLLCGWLGGLRLAEAAELEWDPTTAAPYIDLAGDRIILPAEIVKAVEDQWVPLDPILRQALEALPRHGRKVFRFVNRRGEPVTQSAIGERVIALAKRA